jgi:hypothetical protein
MQRYRRVIIDLEVGAEPIAGSVALPGDDAEAFTGWLQLAAALERAGREPDPPGGGFHNDDSARTVANAGHKPAA